MKRIISLLAAAALIFSFALPCFAVNLFTPSSEQSGAPAIIPPKIDGHPNAVAGIYEDGKLVAVIENGELNVIAYGSKNTENKDARQKLDNAYREILEAGSLGELVEGLENVDPDVGADEYVAKILFDLDVLQDVVDFLKAHKGAYLQVTFDTKYKSADEVPTIIFKCDQSNWEIVDKKNVTYNASNGSITVRFYELCPIAFLVPDGSKLLVGEWTVVSPGTVEVSSYGWIIAVSAVVMVSAAAAFVVSTKKRHA